MGIVEILIAALALLGVGGAYVKGRIDARKKSDAERIKGQLAAERRRNETLQKANEVDDSINSSDIADVHRRLRNRWTRDN